MYSANCSFFLSLQEASKHHAQEIQKLKRKQSLYNDGTFLILIMLNEYN